MCTRPTPISPKRKPIKNGPNIKSVPAGGNKSLYALSLLTINSVELLSIDFFTGKDANAAELISKKENK